MSAGADQKPKQLYEFGPFRVDPEKELLLRGEATVPLTPKTFQILLVLMRHSKEVVTKDDLMKMIWPDTFVEEANLSRNIFLLRKALGESAQDHQYIVTVPGRGYRFAENVRLVADQELSIVAASHAKVQVEVKETRPWPWLAVAAVLLIGVSVGVFRLFFRKSPMLTAKDTVVLADFSNSTGDPVFDGTLRQGLAVQLEQTPFLSLVSDQRIQRTLRLMNQPGDARITGQTAQEICERTGSAAVLEGSISSLGTQYVLGLRAKSCRTGETLDEEQAQAAKKEDVLNALDRMASSFRSRVGESLATVEKYSTPLEEATTSSLEALKAYSTGVKLGFSAGWAAGVPSLKRAVEIDPQFAMAHAHLGLWYSSIGESVLATESTSRAYELRDRVTDREKFFITVMYQRDVTGNLEAAHQTLELWEQTYPRDLYVHGLLSGFSSQGTGKYEQSIEEAKKALAIDPDFTPGYINLGFSNFYLDRFNDAKSTVDQAFARKVNVPEILLLNFYVAFLNGDEKGMSEAAALAKNVPGAQDWMTYLQALTLARSGQLRVAGETTERAMELARQAGQLERAATYETGEADWEALTGNSSAATKDAAAALKISRGRDVEYAAAFALAVAGDYSPARSMADDLEKRFPEDTSVKFNYLPALRGLFALHDGSPEHAIEVLQPAVAYEFAVPSIDFNTFFGGLNPIWVRGEAYLAEHKGAEAALEFQKIIDHKGLLASDPVGALAHLQLGRAYAIAGDRTKARMAFKDFLSLWKDADPEIPLLEQAKVEYAKLQ
jgi:DNA-binding winged helix-turn-helix (wHTH) protein/tetratricopeptide (TPR) repeat protein